MRTTEQFRNYNVVNRTIDRMGHGKSLLLLKNAFVNNDYDGNIVSVSIKRNVNKPLFKMQTRFFIQNHLSLCRTKRERCPNCLAIEHFARVGKRPNTFNFRGISRTSRRDRRELINKRTNHKVLRYALNNLVLQLHGA